MASQPSTQSPSPSNARTWSSLFRLLVGGFGVLAALLIPVARWLTYEQDHAMSNVLTMMLLSVFMMCLIGWLFLAPKIGLPRQDHHPGGSGRFYRYFHELIRVSGL